MKNQKKEYILLAQAEKLTGKSRTTLNRLANRNLSECKKENHKLLISKEFLLSIYPKQVNRLGNHKTNQDSALINQLKAENEYLREQNRKLLEVLANLRITIDSIQINQDEPTVNQEKRQLTKTNQKTGKYDKSVVNEAIRLKNEGLSQAEISRRLSVPRSTVRDWLKK